MGKLTYVLGRVFSMDYKAMLRTAGSCAKKCGKNRISLFFDMIVCGFRYGAGYLDYSLFELYKIPDSVRKTYVTRGINNRFCHLANDRSEIDKFENKIKFNQIFKNYIGRDWMDLRESSEKEFAAFLQKHPKVMAKPVDSICGRGIELIDHPETEEISALYQRLKNGQALIEEYIVQHEKMSELYSGSVNTVRIVSVLRDGTVFIPFASVRVGNGKIVDNLNSGGMAALIDQEKGEICTVGADKDGIAYSVHPATGTPFIGHPIPYFQDAVRMVKEAALLVPNVKYVGWDVVITPDRTILIEANHIPGHDIYQLPAHLKEDRIGMLPKFEDAFGFKIYS